MSIVETVTRAAHTAEFLTSHIRDAHSAACRENPLAEIFLLDLISTAVDLEQKINQIRGAIAAAGQTTMDLSK